MEIPAQFMDPGGIGPPNTGLESFLNTFLRFHSAISASSFLSGHPHAPSPVLLLLPDPTSHATLLA
ncbi:hypothetical protein ABZP36_024621 [Zizania latifolia]